MLELRKGFRWRVEITRIGFDLLMVGVWTEKGTSMMGVVREGLIEGDGSGVRQKFGQSLVHVLDLL